jgi:hypothetical protein
MSKEEKEILESINKMRAKTLNGIDKAKRLKIMETNKLRMEKIDKALEDFDKILKELDEIEIKTRGCNENE